MEIYFAALVATHSWSAVKVDRDGLQFFWQYVLKRDWRWVEISSEQASTNLSE